MHGIICHFLKWNSSYWYMNAACVQNLRNISSLVADSLHICYHLKCCGNFTKVSTNRLLFQKELHAQSLNIMLFVVNLLLNSSNLLCGSLTDLHACQNLTGLHDGLTAQISHFQDLI